MARGLVSQAGQYHGKVRIRTTKLPTVTTNVHTLITTEEEEELHEA